MSCSVSASFSNPLRGPPQSGRNLREANKRYGRDQGWSVFGAQSSRPSKLPVPTAVLNDTIRLGTPPEPEPETTPLPPKKGARARTRTRTRTHHEKRPRANPNPTATHPEPEPEPETPFSPPSPKKEPDADLSVYYKGCNPGASEAIP